MSARFKCQSPFAQSGFKLRQICPLWVFLVCSVASGVAGGPDSNWSLRSWQVDNGLPDNIVTGVAQTADGYLWVATHGGLARFDGVRFTSWPLPVPSDRFNSLVRTLMLGREDRLWLALETAGGLVIGLSDRATNVLDAASGVHNSCPVVMVETPEGTEWVSYADGSVCSIAKGKAKLLGPRDGLDGSGLCWLTAEADGHLWFAKAGRVGIFRDGHFETCFALNEETIRIAPTRPGGIWILAGRRLLKCTDGKMPIAVGELPASWVSIAPSVIYEDREGGLWLGTIAGGLFHWDGKVMVPVPITHHDITSLMEDREGNLWVGTEGGGLDELFNRTLELHGPAEGLSFETARSVCEDAQGVVWATGANGDLVRRVAGRWLAVTNGAGWTGGRATCVASDHQGGVWIGTHRGVLYYWRDGKFISLRHQDGLGSDAIWALFVDSRNDLWVSLEAPDLLQRLRDGRFQTFAQPAGSRPARLTRPPPRRNAAVSLCPCHNLYDTTKRGCSGIITRKSANLVFMSRSRRGINKHKGSFLEWMLRALVALSRSSNEQNA